jgi:hypothetical protein
MDARQKALFRNNILTQLHDAAPSAVPADIIAQGARLAGFRATTEEVERELTFAADDKQAELVPHPKSAAFKRWRLTAAGRDFLEAEGLV